MVNFHSKGHRSGNSDPTCCAVQPKTNTNGPLNPAGGQDWLPLVTQLYLTLCDPMDCSPPDSSAMGILQAKILGWVAMSSSRASSQPRHTSPVCLQHCRWILYLLSHWDRYPIFNNHLHLPCACLGQGRGSQRTRDISPPSSILGISSGDGTSPSGMWPIPRSW